MPAPIILPFTLGDWTPPPALARLEGTSLAWRSSIYEDGQKRLLSEFQDKPRIAAVLLGVLAAIQELEDAIWQVLIGIWLDTAEGVQLAGLGLLLDLENAGWSDDIYRVYLKAQLLVQLSDGSGPALVDIMRAIGVTLSLTSMERGGMGEIRITLGELLDGGVEGSDVFALLDRARSTGVRLRLEFPTAELTDAFTFASGDVDETDAARGFADDGETAGGLLDGDERTTEAA